METTRLSSKGQVIIPKSFRISHHWETGLELSVVAVDKGILLTPKTPFEHTLLDDVAGCLKRKRKGALTLEEMNEAVRKGVREAWRARS